jgi:hypothetical protein
MTRNPHAKGIGRHEITQMTRHRVESCLDAATDKIAGMPIQGASKGENLPPTHSDRRRLVLAADEFEDEVWHCQNGRSVLNNVYFARCAESERVARYLLA